MRQVPVIARCPSTSDLSYVLNVFLLKYTQQIAFGSSTFTILRNLQLYIFKIQNSGFIAMPYLVVPGLCPLPDVGDPLDGVTQDKHCRANNHNQWGVNPVNTPLLPLDICNSMFQIHCLYTKSVINNAKCVPLKGSEQRGPGSLDKIEVLYNTHFKCWHSKKTLIVNCWWLLANNVTPHQNKAQDRLWILRI